MRCPDGFPYFGVAGPFPDRFCPSAGPLCRTLGRLLSLTSTLKAFFAPNFMKPEPEPESKPQPYGLGDGPPLNLPSPEQLEQFYALRGGVAK